MSLGKELPKLIEKSQEQIDETIQAINASTLPEEVKSLACNCIYVATWIPRALLQHKITVSNLRRLIFGKGLKLQSNNKSTNGKTNKNTNSTKGQDHQASDNAANQGFLDEAPTTNTKTPGHGRISHQSYEHSFVHQLTVNGMAAGTYCPEYCGGRLYSLPPGILVRIKGQNLACVHKYWVEKLRCALCGKVFSADVPASVGQDKYDAAFKSLLALQKYYLGMPFHRQAYFQSLLGVPVPASTQWQLVEGLAGCALPVFSVLEYMAANGSLIHNDDTVLRIVDVIHHNRLNPNGKRTGMYTTGILSHYKDHKIALFYNSKRHSGENVDRLLAKRDTQLEQALQMCDALSHNVPESFKTILCNCLSHGFRKFDELKEFYPELCLTIIQWLGQVFQHDGASRALNHNNQERLAYHQKHSAPIMKQLKDHMELLIESKQVEPNDALGKAIKYMQRHWEKLTRYLHVAGAPIDNNVLERALKIPIRNRKNSLFYKTEYGAMIGGVLTSIIYTCSLAEINPYHYLVALQEYQTLVAARPKSWLPWNFQESLALLKIDCAA